MWVSCITYMHSTYGWVLQLIEIPEPQSANIGCIMAKHREKIGIISSLPTAVPSGIEWIGTISYVTLSLSSYPDCRRAIFIKRSAISLGQNKCMVVWISWQCMSRHTDFSPRIISDMEIQHTGEHLKGLLKFIIELPKQKKLMSPL